MKGKFLHNKILVGALAAALRLHGYPMRLEHAVQRGQHSRSVDILFIANGCRVVIEVELTPARIPGDWAKAKAVDADLLLIVVPHPQVNVAAKAAIDRLRPATLSGPPQIQVMCLGAALQWIGNNCPGISRSHQLKRSNETL